MTKLLLSLLSWQYILFMIVTGLGARWAYRRLWSKQRRGFVEAISREQNPLVETIKHAYWQVRVRNLVIGLLVWFLFSWFGSLPSIANLVLVPLAAIYWIRSVRKWRNEKAKTEADLDACLREMTEFQAKRIAKYLARYAQPTGSNDKRLFKRTRDLIRRELRAGNAKTIETLSVFLADFASQVDLGQEARNEKVLSAIEQFAARVENRLPDNKQVSEPDRLSALQQEILVAVETSRLDLSEIQSMIAHVAAKTDVAAIAADVRSHNEKLEQILGTLQSSSGETPLADISDLFARAVAEIDASTQTTRVLEQSAKQTAESQVVAMELRTNVKLVRQLISEITGWSGRVDKQTEKLARDLRSRLDESEGRLEQLARQASEEYGAKLEVIQVQMSALQAVIQVIQTQLREADSRQVSLGQSVAQVLHEVSAQPIAVGESVSVSARQPLRLVKTEAPKSAVRKKGGSRTYKLVAAVVVAVAATMALYFSAADTMSKKTDKLIAATGVKPNTGVERWLDDLVIDIFPRSWEKGLLQAGKNNFWSYYGGTISPKVYIQLIADKSLDDETIRASWNKSHSEKLSNDDSWRIKAAMTRTRPKVMRLITVGWSKDYAKQYPRIWKALHAKGGLLASYYYWVKHEEPTTGDRDRADNILFNLLTERRQYDKAMGCSY